MCAAGKTLRHRDGACGGPVAGGRDRRGCRWPALLASAPGPGGEPTHPATAREVKLCFPDGSATRTCQPGGAEREAGVKGTLGPWSLAVLAPAANPGSSPRAAGSAFCSCVICGPRGRAPITAKASSVRLGLPERGPCHHVSV